MVVIRLSRGGAKKKPFYKIVAADKRESRDGRSLERLGYFNPVAQGNARRLEINKERVDYWLNKGAKPSERVASLLRDLERPELLEKRKSKTNARKERVKAKKETNKSDLETAAPSTIE